MRTFTTLTLLLLCFSPLRTALGQWIDMTTTPKSSEVQEITPRLTALTHASAGGYRVAFSPDDKLVIISDYDGEVPQEPVPIASSDNRPSGGSAASVAGASADRNGFSQRRPAQDTLPRGQFVGRVVDRITSCVVLETGSGKLYAQLPQRDSGECRYFHAPQFTPSGHSLFGIAERRFEVPELAVWDVAARRISAWIPLPEGCKPAYFDGSDAQGRVLVRNWGATDSDNGDRNIFLFDSSSAKLLAKIAVGAHQQGYDGMNAGGIALSSDGKRFCVGFSEWDLTSGKMIHQLSTTGVKQGNGFWFTSCKQVWFAPDGKHLIGYGGANNKALIWNPEGGCEFAFSVADLHPNDEQSQDSLGSIAFSPDGKWVATNDRHLVRLWHFPTRKLVANLVGHVNRVDDVAFSHDGKMVASGGCDCTTRLWDISAIVASNHDAPRSAAEPVGSDNAKASAATRWFGYALGDEPTRWMSEVAAYTNVVWDYSWEQADDPRVQLEATLKSAREHGLSVIVSVGGKKRFDKFLEVGVDLVKSYSDVVVGVSATLPIHLPASHQDYAHFCKETKRLLPGVKLSCLMVDTADNYLAFPIPDEVDIVGLDCCDCTTVEEVRHRIEDVFPRWTAKPKKCPLFIAWDNWSDSGSGGAAPRCQAGVFRALANYVQSNHFAGLIVSSYNANHYAGKLSRGVKERPELVQEMRDIAKDWRVKGSGNEVGKTGPDTAVPAQAFDHQIQGTANVSVKASEHETMRFYTRESRPEIIAAHAVSPDGRYLALSFDSSQINARSGVTIIDLETVGSVGSFGSFSYFTLAFSSDSRTILGIGNYAGICRTDVNTGKVRSVKTASSAVGSVGFQIELQDGKLLVTGIAEDAALTLGDRLRVGDEILAVNEGEKPTRYDDGREWTPLLGESQKEAMERIQGPPGTWIQLRLARRGTSTPIGVSVQRRWQAGASRSLPNSNACMTFSVTKGHKAFFSADTGAECAFISLRDTDRAGLAAISPDGKLFAWVSKVVGGRDLCVEVHSLAEGTLKAGSILNASNYRDIHFSPDSQKVLIGTRDTIEIFNFDTATWDEALSLTATENRDKGRTHNRQIPAGFGFRGDLYATVPEVVYSKPAALTQFDVSPAGIVAVGSETGDIVLLSLKTKQRVGILGEGIPGTEAELIKFTPTGGHLLAYAKGNLHIFKMGGPRETPRK